MSLFTLYLVFVVLPSLACWISMAAFTFAMAAAVLGIASVGETYREEGKRAREAAKKSLIAAIITGILSIFLPSTSQIYTVIGAYGATNSAEIMKLPDNIAKAANSYLEKLNEDSVSKKK